MAVQVRKRSLETKKDSKSLVRQIQQQWRERRDQTSGFCLIIHLKRSKEGRGGGDGDWRRGEASCCTKESKCSWLFHPAGEVTPAPPQLSRQSGTRVAGGNLWKDHNPEPRAWKKLCVDVFCVWVRWSASVCLTVWDCFLYTVAAL